jgi:hypothetical protein
MWKDPIVAETRDLRDEYARQFNYDIDAIFKDLMAKQAKHPERIVSFAPRKPTIAVITQQEDDVNGDHAVTKSLQENRS